MKIKAVLFATGMREIWITLCIDSVSILINLISSFIFSENSSIFQGQLNEKKIEPITLIVWVQGGVEKMPKKGQKNEKKNIFLFTNNKV